MYPAEKLTSSSASCFGFCPQTTLSKVVIIALAIVAAAGLTAVILGTRHILPFKAVWIGSGVAGGSLIGILFSVIYGRQKRGLPASSPSTSFTPSKIETATHTHQTSTLLATRVQLLSSLDQFEKRLDKNIYDEMSFAIEPKKSKEEDKSEERLSNQFRQFNQQVFKFVKSEKKEIATPDEFMWILHQNKESLSDSRTAIPFATFERMELQEDQSYSFVFGFSKNTPPLTTSQDGGVLFIQKNGKISLHTDGFSKSYGVYVNSTYYPSEKVKGRVCDLKEGDRVFTSSNQFSFEVGKNGEVLYPLSKKKELEVDQSALSQSVQFLAQHSCKEVRASSTSSLPWSGEILLGSPLEPGFVVLPIDWVKAVNAKNAKVDQEFIIGISQFLKQDENCIQVYVDIEKDEVLRNLVAYLKVEFEVMEYTPKQKILRLIAFTSDLMTGGKYDGSSNYLLGELISVGIGGPKLHSLLMKSLADHLGIQCGMVFSLITRPALIKFNQQPTIGEQSNVSYAWNFFSLDDANWIVDTCSDCPCMFSLNNPPGKDGESKKKILRMYGS